MYILCLKVKNPIYRKTEEDQSKSEIKEEDIYKST